MGGDTSSVPRVAHVDATNGSLVCVAGPGYTDCILAAGVAPPDLVDMNSLVAIARVFDDGRMESTAVGDGRRLTVDTSRLKALVSAHRSGLQP